MDLSKQSKKQLPCVNNLQWTQFSNNLETARDWINHQLEKEGLTPPLGHQALNLGMVETVRRLLDKSSNHQKGIFIGLRFRIARLDEEKNPYEHLLPIKLRSEFYQYVDRTLQSRSVFEVAIDGGIGDLLEAISILKPWIKRHNPTLKIFGNPTHRDLILPLLGKGSKIDIANDYGHGVKYMLLRSWISANEKDLYSSKWINRDFIEKINRNKFICCWRAEGAEAKFSAFSRSLGFDHVQGFYINLRAIIPNAEIIDISKWKPWESESLINHGIKLYDPKEGTLEDLLRMINGRRVFTIDTALAHLCAASGHPATVLLPMFPDERWLELKGSNTNYRQNLNFIQQVEFCSWRNPLREILAAV